ncbi:D-sedoheptulose-7-phosphate isomerase [Mumia qirimensis]|uniref:D-sedoheptulose-7-phosphate isomerase n=1 Tax=Mumia qirimensis TaxID=3234852 RepID=UPI00351D0D4F
MSTTQHVAHLRDALERFEHGCTVLEDWGSALVRVLTSGGRLLAAGNGGSAAQAQHLTAELVGRYQGERRPFSAICLSAETSSLTAITNDYPPDELFARQVEAHGRPGDVFVGLSTSGSSANVVNAARRARACGLKVWALTGPAPNPLADASDSYVAVEAASTATVQEMHLVALHLLCEVFDEHLRISEPTGAVADLAEAHR